MPLNGLTIADGATSIAATGGTTKTFTPDGQSVFNGIHVADMSQADFRLRPHVSFKNRNPQRLASGAYGKGKRDTIYTEPWLNASTGEVLFVTIRTIVEFAPEIPAATVKNARFKAAQLQFVASTENFNAAGDIS